MSFEAAATAVLVACVTLETPLVLPFAVSVGICAWRGMPAEEAWERLNDESGIDAGRVPAGLSF